MTATADPRCQIPDPSCEVQRTVRVTGEDGDRARRTRTGRRLSAGARQLEDATMSFSRLLLMLLRVGIGVQVIVGIAMWTGHWFYPPNFHMLVGLGFVVVLWLLALTAIVRGRTIWLALLALVWGFVIAVFGFLQMNLLMGDLHWIVRVAHLAIGLAAMPIAERLAPKQASVA
jgi:uncharacterized membrane protein YczE